MTTAIAGAGYTNPINTIFLVQHNTVVALGNILIDEIYSEHKHGKGWVA